MSTRKGLVLRKNGMAGQVVGVQVAHLVEVVAHVGLGICLTSALMTIVRFLHVVPAVVNNTSTTTTEGLNDSLLCFKKNI